MQKSNLYKLNDTLHEPTAAGGIPLLIEILENVSMGAMTAGVVTKEVKSAFGKNLGEAIAIIPAKSKDGNNQALAYQVAAGSTDGTLLITQHSTSASSTSNITNTFVILGRIIPKNVS